MQAVLVLVLMIGAPIRHLLPSEAVVIETRPLPLAAHRGRTLVLWMLSPKASPCPSAPSCPDMTRGCYLSGPTRISLVDTAAMRLINTVTITDPVTGVDSFDIPRKLGLPGPYHAAKGTRRPTVLWLNDYNGDGQAFELALFDSYSCSDLFTTLIGYSTQHDVVVNYPIRAAGCASEECSGVWAEKLFATAPAPPGHWRYTLAWPGDDPPQECVTIYLPEAEAFQEDCVVTR